MNLEFISIISDVTAQTRSRGPNLLGSIALRQIMQHQKYANICLPGVESFPAIYNINDFTKIIFHCYNTNTDDLKKAYLSLEYSENSFLCWEPQVERIFFKILKIHFTLANEPGDSLGLCSLIITNWSNNLCEPYH